MDSPLSGFLEGFVTARQAQVQKAQRLADEMFRNRQISLNEKEANWNRNYQEARTKQEGEQQRGNVLNQALGRYQNLLEQEYSGEQARDIVLGQLRQAGVEPDAGWIQSLGALGPSPKSVAERTLREGIQKERSRHNLESEAARRADLYVRTNRDAMGRIQQNAKFYMQSGASEEQAYQWAYDNEVATQAEVEKRQLTQNLAQKMLHSFGLPIGEAQGTPVPGSANPAPADEIPNGPYAQPQAADPVSLLLSGGVPEVGGSRSQPLPNIAAQIAARNADAQIKQQTLEQRGQKFPLEQQERQSRIATAAARQKLADAQTKRLYELMPLEKARLEAQNQQILSNTELAQAKFSFQQEQKWLDRQVQSGQITTQAARDRAAQRQGVLMSKKTALQKERADLEKRAGYYQNVLRSPAPSDDANAVAEYRLAEAAAPLIPKRIAQIGAMGKEIDRMMRENNRLLNLGVQEVSKSGKPVSTANPVVGTGMGRGQAGVPQNAKPPAVVETPRRGASGLPKITPPPGMKQKPPSKNVQKVRFQSASDLGLFD